jgi:hypothetical protein
MLLSTFVYFRASKHRGDMRFKHRNSADASNYLFLSQRKLYSELIQAKNSDINETKVIWSQAGLNRRPLDSQQYLMVVLDQRSNQLSYATVGSQYDLFYNKRDINAVSALKR